MGLPPSDHDPAAVRELADQILAQARYDRPAEPLPDRIMGWIGDQLGPPVREPGQRRRWHRPRLGDPRRLRSAGVAYLLVRHGRVVPPRPDAAGRGRRHGRARRGPPRSGEPRRPVWRRRAGWPEGLRCRHRALVGRPRPARAPSPSKPGRTAGEYVRDVADVPPDGAVLACGRHRALRGGVVRRCATGAAEAARFDDLDAPGARRSRSREWRRSARRGRGRGRRRSRPARRGVARRRSPDDGARSIHGRTLRWARAPSCRSSRAWARTCELVGGAARRRTTTWRCSSPIGLDEDQTDDVLRAGCASGGTLVVTDPSSSLAPATSRPGTRRRRATSTRGCCTIAALDGRRDGRRRGGGPLRHQPGAARRASAAATSRSSSCSAEGAGQRGRGRRRRRSSPTSGSTRRTTRCWPPRCSLRARGTTVRFVDAPLPAGGGDKTSTATSCRTASGGRGCSSRSAFVIYAALAGRPARSAGARGPAGGDRRLGAGGRHGPTARAGPGARARRPRSSGDGLRATLRDPPRASPPTLRSGARSPRSSPSAPASTRTTPAPPSAIMPSPPTTSSSPSPAPSHPSTRRSSIDADPAPPIRRAAVLAVREEVGKVVVGQEGVALRPRHRAARQRPRAARGRARRGQDAARQGAGRRARPRLRPGAVHARPDAVRRDRPGDLSARRAGGAAGTFRFREGPVFTNLLLADEINRTPPKTQAALLEAMEERQVTIEGQARAAARPVHRRRDPEPGRVRGHVPAARGAARPLPAQAAGRATRSAEQEQEVLAPPRRRGSTRTTSRRVVRPVATAADLAAARAARRRGARRAARARLRRQPGPGDPGVAVAVRSACRPAAPPCCCTPPRRGRG